MGRLLKKSTNIWRLIVLSVLFAPCFLFATAVVGVPVNIFNDLDIEPEGRVIEVDKVETTLSKKNKYHLKIYPGDTMQVSRGSVLSFSISRLYPAHKVKYEVVCPDEGEDVTMSILEIHNNTINGPCRLKRIGHWSRRTGVQWNEVE
jgi:hypothetical protein